MNEIKLALTGAARTGKDEVAAYLGAYHGFYRTAFAKVMKEEFHRIFPHISPNPKPRAEYQQFGEAMCALDPDVWIRHVADEALRYTYYCRGQQREEARFIITDLRKPTEYEWARANGFKIIRVTAPTEIRKARAAATGEQFDEATMAHETERFAAGFDVDYELVNDGSISELRAKVGAYLSVLSNTNIPSAMPSGCGSI